MDRHTLFLVYDVSAWSVDVDQHASRLPLYPVMAVAWMQLPSIASVELTFNNCMPLTLVRSANAAVSPMLSWLEASLEWGLTHPAHAHCLDRQRSQHIRSHLNYSLRCIALPKGLIALALGTRH
jgi:hypothetical protein